MMRAGRAAAVIALLAVFAGACERPRRQEPSARGPGARRIPATVLTVRTTVVPDDKAYLHKVVISGTKARLGSELDRWRLFDLEARTVTTVDNVTKTYRTDSFAELLAARRRLLATPLPPNVPVARYEKDETETVVAGVATSLHRITMGGYKRELWLSVQPMPADNLFPMVLATEPIQQPYAGVMRQAFAALVAQNGYPMIDRSEMRWDDRDATIERRVMKIEQTTIPASWIEIPPAFEDLTPKSKEEEQKR